MAETERPRRIGRSIFAVVAGIFAGVVITTLTDIVLHAVHVYPPWGEPVGSKPLLLATAYRIVYGGAGCYIIARLAPDRPMQHALVGGLVGLIVSVVGAVVTWNRGPGFGPHWYPLAVIAIALPSAWAGGKLRLMQLRAE